ncbi:ArsC/Spx/MgsR family protein [Lactococcus formosensis]|uniref:ArsC/Spx/MgsR family protein n=1 Tax=Lactococcus formosensis TaxID=1281486 RepID=UPI0039F6FA9E
MITLYYDVGNASCIQAMKWFKEYNIKINTKRIEQMSSNELICILSLTENGFSDILKCPTRAGQKVLNQIKNIEDSTFNSSINYILNNTNLLKGPIIIDNNKLVIGYKAENMRIFLPSKYREAELI